MIACAAFVLVGISVVAGGFALGPVKSQRVVYAGDGGEVISLNPGSGEETEIYGGEGFATSPRTVGRSLSFTVLRGAGEALRGDLYAADLVRQTRSRLLAASSGEVFTPSAFSPRRERVLAGRYARREAPNVVAMPASSAQRDYLLEPGIEGRPALMGPEWGRGTVIYVWSADDGKFSLSAYDVLEERRISLYETERVVSAPVYLGDRNSIVFAERPEGGGREKSRLKVFMGTQEIEISGTEGLGLYDPSPPVFELGNKVAVAWTDGEKSGLGLIDPADWSFEKTGIEFPESARNPRVSPDGSMVAFTDRGGGRLTVLDMGDGEVVERVDGLQSPRDLYRHMEEAGFSVPDGAIRLAPPSFGWRNVSGGF